MAGLLSPEEVTHWLSQTPGWAHEGQSISRTYTFRDFSEAMAFVLRVALAAEKTDHHPDIAVSYNRVALSVWTHSAGGLTEQDFQLARAANGFA